MSHLTSSNLNADHFSRTVKVIVVPNPGIDCIVILPPSIFTSFCEMVSPSPVPFMLNWSLCLWTIPKTWNSPLLSASEIPTSVSVTVTFSSLSRRSSTNSKATVMPRTRLDIIYTVRELVRVRDQVHEHLPNAVRVRVEPRAHQRGHFFTINY